MNNTILSLTITFGLTFSATAFAGPGKESVVETTSETPADTTWANPFEALGWEYESGETALPIASLTDRVEVTRDEQDDAVAAIEKSMGPLAVTDTGRGYFDLKPFARGVGGAFLAIAEGEG